jgi:DNA-directed RNA polymerase specialized sigma24 family protein
MSRQKPDRSAVEARFQDVFAQLGFIAAYARRREAQDPDGIAAETMAIAWRRLADVPVDDPRPWLIVTARNLLMAERRRQPAARRHGLDGIDVAAPPSHWRRSSTSTPIWPPACERCRRRIARRYCSSPGRT